MTESNPLFLRKKNLYLFFFIIISITATLVFLWDKKKETISYNIISIKKGDIEESISALANIVPSNIVNVGTQVTGQIKKLNINVGDNVKRNDLIAEIDDTSQQNEYIASQTRFESLKAQLNAKIATSLLDEINFRREKEIFRKGFSSQLDYEKADVTQKISKAEVKSLEAQLQEAKTLVDTARINLGYTRITSPIAGTVVALLATEGQTVNANQTTPNLVKVANLSTMSIVAKISEADIKKVKVGQKAIFSTLGSPNEKYITSINTIEPAPINISQNDDITEPTQGGIYYRATMNIDNINNQFNALMTAQIKIIISEAKNTLIIPSTLLRVKNSDGSYTINIIDSQGTPALRRIKIGINNRIMAQVLEGMTPDEKIIVNIP
ncbi:MULTISPECIES: efflux RND transporter periplasmic adaptor subunit [Brenneria]|uniref:Efflux RND transporter periplasmic adaptor subunit n=1 Tax=Brenneria nigrifluens DSM 30175 = ATCC 13028 TaxID=1121120 RepID=A0A2U1UK70_9GAMM|nr:MULTISPECIES: efflux RND transporter periplasmic adaptor subunit [Brenneria]EHD20356.1 efflux transporter, RND family, MFP subunit [Brenneria sp. EniD312]PWC22037.1 efflux RND transporter periplasmic adaptor subunit [Brenneria nigrifluens DSM 30175 = ATCC 13028]QCR03564.1 efflux RND transporter periplasmic adaptor subunit [Brenneria nigrifluens DSM 30175 = ATCC 13028]